MKRTLLLFTVAVVAACSQPSKTSENSSEQKTDSTTQGNSVNLPAPYASKSSVNPSKVIGWKENGAPVAPAGFTVTKYASGLENPRWIYVLPNGDVLVAETKKVEGAVKKVMGAVTGEAKSKGKSDVVNRITLFRDTNKDGVPEVKQTFLEDLYMPFGMVLVNNNFYVANTDGVWRFPYKEGETAIRAKGEKILELPTGGRHWTRNIIANAAGTKLYIAVGSASNVAEDGIDKEVDRACIIEINPDGTGKRIYASGLRNPVGMDWRPNTNTLYTAVNERDELGDDLVPDYLTSVRDGGFYGWPYSYFGQNLDPRIKAEQQRPDLVKASIVPDVSLDSHSASLGLAFYNREAFPAKYKGGAFIGQHGSWNRAVPSGYKVVFVPFDGTKGGKPEDFLTGFMADAGKNEVYGRPVGVAVLPDGSLLVADDAGNTVWKVTYNK